MSTISADASLLDGELFAQRRGNGALWIALVLSLLLHAAVVALFPALRVPPPPQLQVLKVEFQYAPPPSNEPEQPAAKPPVKHAEQSRKTFQRQNLDAPPPPAITPQPQAIDPRSEVTAVPRLEPHIVARANVPEPVRDVRAQPGPLPEAARKPQQRDERPPSEMAAPARSEPKLERRAEPRPEPRTEPRVEPERSVPKPRAIAKADPRVEPDVSEARQPFVPAQNPTTAPRELQTESALGAPKTEVATPKTEPPPTAPRGQREQEVKSQSRPEPVVMARPQPKLETPAPLSAQPAPLPEPQIAQPRPQNPEARAEVRTAAPLVSPPPAPTTEMTIAPGSVSEPTPRTSQSLPLAPEQRKQPPPIAAPKPRAPQILSELNREPAAPTSMPNQPAPMSAPTPHPPEVAPLNREPAVPANIPSPPSMQEPAPVQQPSSRTEKIPEPPATLAAIQPPAKRNKVDEDAAARAYATQLARLIGKSVSKRDYPRIAQDRRWEGTTQLVVRFHVGGRLSEVTVASSSGYDVLDQRAVELMNQITLPAVPTEIQSRAFAVRIPVNFTLKEQ